MTGPTLAMMLVFAIAALSAKRGAALGIVILSMMIWPEYLRVQMGPILMSVPRIVALALLVKLIQSGSARDSSPSKVDKLVIYGWAWTVLATMLAGAEISTTTEMIGRGFDTVLMYFVARYSLLTAEDVKSMFVPLLLVGVVLGSLGAIESVTTYSPYRGMDAYMDWGWFDKEDEYRAGFLRAKGSTSVHIYFGMAMVFAVSIFWAVRSYSNSKFFTLIGVICFIFGVLSTMSSGPWIGGATLIICNLYRKHTNLIKPTLWFLLAFSIFLEIASNRHFYHLIDYLSMNSPNAWYRTRLVEVAVSQWRDYWLVGKGDNPLSHWGPMIDGRQHVDGVNHFVMVALNGGLLGLYLYVASHVRAIKDAISSWSNTGSEEYRTLLFCLSAGLVALNLASNSVGLFGPPLLLSYILLGVLVSASVQLADNGETASDGVQEAEIPWYDQK